MLIQTERTSGGDGPAFSADPGLEPVLDSSVAPAGTSDGPSMPDPADAPGTDALWTIAAAVWRRRWWIAAFTVVAAGCAVAFALWLPNYFTSEARVMLPEKGGSSMSSLIESVAPGASGLLGGGGGDYTRYLAILTSRSVAERAVQRFGLVEVYQTQEKASPEAAAVSEFQRNAAFTVSLEYNYLGIAVRDKSPRRAAQMANYLVGELNTENTRLSSESASERRQFIEGAPERGRGCAGLGPGADAGLPGALWHHRARGPGPGPDGLDRVGVRSRRAGRDLPRIARVGLRRHGRKLGGQLGEGGAGRGAAAAGPPHVRPELADAGPARAAAAGRAAVRAAEAGAARAGADHRVRAAGLRAGRRSRSASRPRPCRSSTRPSSR